ncbi:MAG: hypothetical protein AB7P20_26350 [Rhizobiaceae bacterium]
MRRASFGRSKSLFDVLSGCLLAIAIMLGGAQASSLKALLSEKLWTKRDAYDAAHFLMIPMIDAYERDDTATMESFRGLVGRYLDEQSQPDLGLLTELQFSYLISRFAAVEATKSGCTALVRKTRDRLTRDVTGALLAPAWLWTMPDFPNMFDRADWKLAQKATKPSYLRAFFDEELFAFAISADLTVVARACDEEPAAVIGKAVELGRHIMLAEGQFQNGRWQFQPGVWRDHPDFAYAGNTMFGPGLEKNPVDGIGGDSSHASRLPLIIDSLICASPKESAARKKLEEVRIGLTKSFLDDVYMPPSRTFPAVRLTNYMTGHNGVYRYSYATVGPGGGYGPFGLTSTFNLGWWAMLGSALQAPYRLQLNSLPFSGAVMELYLEPHVTDDKAPRDRNPAFADKAYLQGDFIAAVLESSIRVAERNRGCPLD